MRNRTCVRTDTRLASPDRADPELLAKYEHELHEYAAAADAAIGEYPSVDANAAVVRSYLARCPVRCPLPMSRPRIALWLMALVRRRRKLPG